MSRGPRHRAVACSTRWAAVLAAIVLLASACSSRADDGDRSSPALPGFCDWAVAIEGAIPPPPEPTDPEEPADVERLVVISNQLVAFASTLESAASFAPSADQTAFTELAGFNREVASVITGSGSLREGASESAAEAADVVTRSLRRECGVQIDPDATLAFAEA